MTLIDGWKQALKLRSVQVALLGAVIGAVIAGLQSLAGGQSPWVALLMTVISLLTALARIVHQPELH